MDISLPQSSQSSPLLPTGNISSLNLKLNQQLDAKVIKSYINTQILALQFPNSNQSFHVQTNLAIQIKPGQSFHLLVTKLSPVAEFKVIGSNSEIKPSTSLLSEQSLKTLDVNDLVFKQLIPATNQTKLLPPLSTPPAVITAEIIAIRENKIQLKLYPTPQMPVTKPALLETDTLKDNKSSALSTAIPYIKEKLLSQQQHPIEKLKTFNKNTIITVRKEDLIPSDTQSDHKKHNPQLQELSSFKPGQKIQLINVSEKNANPTFKIINSTPERLNIGQIINASVLDIKKNNVQLLLHMPNLSHRNASAIDHNSTKQTHIINLNKSQLIRPIANLKNLEINSKNSLTDHGPSLLLPNIKNVQAESTQLLAIDHLKPGQLIKFEVVKTGIRPEFKLLENEPLTDLGQKALKTFKHLLPIQESPSEIVNQLIKNLPAINKNESIPENLKRLAREILNSIPQIKNEKIDPKQLKQSTLNSGLFLEAKLSRSTENNGPNLDIDFKSQLLKLDHALKQELNVKNQQQLQLSDVDLIKEMQQKTESTLAKIILNQLSSLPKEDGTRQAWVLDLPFLNKEFSESVKIEINQEQKKEKDTQKDNWAVTITITPPDLGSINCKVSCFDKTINARFWSDRKDVVEKITQNLDHLKTQFEKAGLHTGHISAHTGVANKQSSQSLVNERLFDQKV